MAFAILRHGKLKGAAIAAADSHNQRNAPVPHSNGGRVKRVVGRPDIPLEQQINERITQAGAKVRSNSVKAMELVLSASPEHFRPGDPDRAGSFEKEPTKEWLDASLNWLKSRYKENLITVDIHLDESTPHLHAVIVPLTQDHRLSAKETHGKEQLSENQSSYAEALAGLGLERGVASTRKHSKVQSWYRDAKQKLRLSRDAQGKDKKAVEQYKRRAEAAERRAEAAERRAEAAERQIEPEVQRRVKIALHDAVEPYKAAYAKQQEQIRLLREKKGPAIGR